MSLSKCFHSSFRGGPTSEGIVKRELELSPLPTLIIITPSSRAFFTKQYFAFCHLSTPVGIKLFSRLFSTYIEK